MSAFTYYGGKTLYSKDIAAFIEKACEGRRVDKYVEPFCGWCSVISQLVTNGKLRPKQFVASDYNKSLVQMWRGLSRRTWKVPDRVITKKEWLALKDAPPSPLKAFVGVIYSFNGRYFSWYRVPLRPDSHRLQERADLLSKVKFLHKKYDDPEYLQARNCVFYLDPPYQSRAFEYKHDTNSGAIATPTFDHAHFWDVARQLSKHNIVIVSEYTAPPDFKCVSTLEKRGQKNNQNVNCVSPHPEKLFMYKPRVSQRAAQPVSRRTPSSARSTAGTSQSSGSSAVSRSSQPATAAATPSSGLRPLSVRQAPPPRPQPPRPPRASKA